LFPYTTLFRSPTSIRSPPLGAAASSSSGSNSTSTVVSAAAGPVEVDVTFGCALKTGPLPRSSAGGVAEADAAPGSGDEDTPAGSDVSLTGCPASARIRLIKARALRQRPP